MSKETNVPIVSILECSGYDNWIPVALHVSVIDIVRYYLFSREMNFVKATFESYKIEKGWNTSNTMILINFFIIILF